MEIGAIFVVIAILIFVIGFVIKPLLSEDKKYEEKPIDNFSALMAEQDRLVTAIHELESDNDLGKIPDEVFAEQKEDLTLRAISVMKELDEIKGEEKPIKKKKKKSKQTSVDDIEKMIEARKASISKNKDTKVCEECGEKIQKGDKFCASCGVTCL